MFLGHPFHLVILDRGRRTTAPRKCLFGILQPKQPLKKRLTVKDYSLTACAMLRIQDPSHQYIISLVLSHSHATLRKLDRCGRMGHVVAELHFYVGFVAGSTAPCCVPTVAS